MKTSKKSKRVQTDNNSTQPLEKVKIIDHYPDLFFLQSKPVNEAFIQRVAERMIEWAKKPTSYRITQFFNEEGIPSTYIYRWMEIHPNLKLAHEYAFSMIADRREIGALEKRLDGVTMREMQPIWDPVYKSLLEWKSKLAKQEQMQGNVQVIIQKFPELEQDEGKRLATTSNTRSER